MRVGFKPVRPRMSEGVAEAGRCVKQTPAVFDTNHSAGAGPGPSAGNASRVDPRTSQTEAGLAKRGGGGRRRQAATALQNEGTSPARNPEGSLRSRSGHVGADVVQEIVADEVTVLTSGEPSSSDMADPSPDTRGQFEQSPSEGIVRRCIARFGQLKKMGNATCECGRSTGLYCSACGARVCLDCGRRRVPHLRGVQASL